MEEPFNCSALYKVFSLKLGSYSSCCSKRQKPFNVAQGAFRAISVMRYTPTDRVKFRHKHGNSITENYARKFGERCGMLHADRGTRRDVPFIYSTNSPSKYVLLLWL